MFQRDGGLSPAVGAQVLQSEDAGQSLPGHRDCPSFPGENSGVRFGSKVVQIGTNGTNLGVFSEQISVDFDSASLGKSLNDGGDRVWSNSVQIISIIIKLLAYVCGFRIDSKTT